MEKVFRKLSKAREYQKKHKKMYGYTPAVFHFTGKHKYVVVKPDGLKRL